MEQQFLPVTDELPSVFLLMTFNLAQHSTHTKIILTNLFFSTFFILFELPLHERVCPDEVREEETPQKMQQKGTCLHLYGIAIGKAFP